VFNPFQPLEKIKAEVYTSMPAKFRKKCRTAWSDPNRQGAEVECFLEGPSFDRAGNLYCVDIPFGRIFRISPKGEWELIVQYDGWPNGLKFHKDGRAFITCYKQGSWCLAEDRQAGNPAGKYFQRGFKGVNSPLRLERGLYFTDQADRHCRPDRARLPARANGASAGSR
jgi:gluconolactonase